MGIVHPPSDNEGTERSCFEPFAMNTGQRGNCDVVEMCHCCGCVASVED